MSAECSCSDEPYDWGGTAPLAGKKQRSCKANSGVKMNEDVGWMKLEVSMLAYLL